ncbi:MAG: NB-ARC domain-containing protein [Nitrospira sp.]|nr:NB-ARC domain-containing protein [Nitrospira sp.]
MTVSSASEGSIGSRVFLSYARKENSEFVARLHNTLTAAGVHAWLDLIDMPNRSLTFLQEIRDEIESCDRVLAIVGPAALASRYVQSEWQHGFLFGKGIVPILRQGSWSDLPKDLQTLHGIDFSDDARYDDRISELLRILAVPVKEPGPFRRAVPALPPHYVLPESELSALRARLLEDVCEPTVVRAERQIVCVTGMPGIGKSSLAAAAARMTDVRRAFQNGVVWLSVGRPADTSPASLNDKLNELKRSLIVAVAKAFDQPTDFGDLDRGEAALARILAPLRTLLVLDDVWNREIIELFRNALGHRCRLLITTRQQYLATDFGTGDIQPQLLSPDEAQRLLARWAGVDSEALPTEARALAGACGGLPLATALVGAINAGGRNRWSQTLQALQSADLAALQRRLPGYPYPNLLQALHASVEFLRSDVDVEPLKDKITDLYASLAVFPEDDAIPESAIVVLWLAAGVPEPSCVQVIDMLVERWLLTKRAPGHFALHDVQHDYVRALAGDLRVLHSKLVDAYRARAPRGWTGGSLDNYCRARLAHHLVRAGRPAELHQLLLETRADSRNGWFEEKLGAGDLTGYVEDLELAAVSAREQARSANPTEGVGLEVRYAVIQSTLASLAANLPPPMFVALVKNKLWTPGRAKGYALKIQRIDVRVATIMDLLPLTEPATRTGWLMEIIEQIERADADERLPWLLAVTKTAGALAHEGKELLLTRIAAWPSPPPVEQWWNRPSEPASLIERLAPHLDEAQAVRLARVLLARQDAVHPGSFVRAAIALMSCVPEAERVALWDKFREVASSIAYSPSPDDLDEVTAANQRVPELIPWLIDCALACPAGPKRLSALTAVLPLLDEERRSAAIDELRAHLPEWSRASPEREPITAITMIARFVASEERAALIDIARRSHLSELSKARLVIRLSAGLPLMKQLIDDAEAGTLPDEDVAFLAGRCEGQDTESLQRIVVRARKLSSSEDKIAAMAGVARWLPAEARNGVLDEALACIQALDAAKDPSAIARALAELSPALDREHLLRALQLGTRLADEEFLLGGLGNLEPLAELPLRTRILRLALGVAAKLDDWQKAQLLEQLPAELPAELESLIIDLCDRIVTPTYKIAGLVALASRVSQPARDAALRHALELAEDKSPSRSPSDEAIVWAQIGSAHDEAERSTFVQRARRGFDKCEDNYALARVIPYLVPVITDTDKPAFLSSLVERGLQIAWKGAEEILKQLAPHLPRALVRRALRLEDSSSSNELTYYHDGKRFGDAFVPLVRQLALVDGPDAAWRVAAGSGEANAMCAVIPKLSKELLPAAFDAARAIAKQNEYLAGQTLAEVYARWAALVDADAALAWSKALQKASYRVLAIAGVVPHLRDVRRQRDEVCRVAVEAAELPYSEWRTPALHKLVPSLAVIPRDELLPTWEAMLKILVRRIRRQFMHDLYVLGPVIVQLGDGDALEATVSAVENAARWWP